MTYTLKITRGSGASFAPAVMAKNKEDYQADAMNVATRLAGNLWPSDSEYRAQVLKRIATDSESTMREQLAKWSGYLRASLTAAHDPKTSSFYTWADNHWNDLRFQRAHVQLWAAGIVARGFAAPDPVELAKLDTEAGQQQDTIGRALVSEAYRRGQNEGQRVASLIAPWKGLDNTGAALVELIKALVAQGEQAVKLAVQSGIGFLIGAAGLVGLLALFAYAKR